MSRHARYEQWTDPATGEKHFRIRAKNGRIVGPTEGFDGHINRAIGATRRAMAEADKHPVLTVPPPKKRRR